MMLVTLLPRILPILLLSDRRMPPIVERWLALIAPAILAALLLPELLLDKTQSPATLMPLGANGYLPAAIPAFIVAWRAKSLFGTVVVGIVAVALLRLLMS